MAGGKARLPPRWFVVTAWHVHRRIVRASGGRKGVWPPRQGKWGALRLTTRGRRGGEPRQVILGYYEDGPNLVTMAMNGWGAAEPAWWLNLQAHADAQVEVSLFAQPTAAWGPSARRACISARSARSSPPSTTSSRPISAYRRLAPSSRITTGTEFASPRYSAEPLVQYLA